MGKIRIRICWWGRSRDLCRHFRQQVSGLEFFDWENPDYNLLVGKEQGIIAAIQQGSRLESFGGEDPDYNLLEGKEQGIFAAVFVRRDPDQNFLVREDPDYNLLVGNEQGILVAISLSSTGTPLMTDS